MRDLFKNVMTGSMVAGAALFVAACGGGEDASTNNTMNTAGDEAMMGTGNDVTAIDAANVSTDMNLGTAADMNASTTTSTTTNTTGTTGTGNTTGTTGTGNTTGM